MARTHVSTNRRTGKPQSAEKDKKKLTLYPLTIEDALRAAAKTGRPPPLESQKPKRQRKKRTKSS